VGVNPRAPDHAVEWRRVLEGDPVEVNPSEGYGLKVMTIAEWCGKWKVRRAGAAWRGRGGRGGAAAAGVV
jgi:hypothetical protein